MTTREELFLRAISSFVEEDGFAHFTFNNLTTICKSDHFKKYLDSLIEQGHLEDFTENGYCKKMKVNTQLDCPDFIFNPEFDIRMLDYLLERWDEYTQGTPLQRKGKCDSKLLMLGTTLDALLENVKLIHNKIATAENCELIYTEHGYKVKRIAYKEFYCQYCGETDPSKFSEGSPHICKECQNKINRAEIPLEEKLLKRSRASARSRGFEHTITITDIKEQLEKQKHKCYYSGIDFGDTFLNKWTYPTVDRIDSTKGYVKGNICICTFYVNMMKSNASIDQFKDIITKIYNNIDNF